MKHSISKKLNKHEKMLAEYNDEYSTSKKLEMNHVNYSFSDESCQLLIVGEKTMTFELLDVYDM